MNTTNIYLSRLEELLKVVEAIPPEKLQLWIYWNPYNQCGCVIGHAANHPPFNEQGFVLGGYSENVPMYKGYKCYEAAVEFFGLKDSEEDIDLADLFPVPSHKAKEIVLDRVKRLIETNQKLAEGNNEQET